MPEKVRRSLSQSAKRAVNFIRRRRQLSLRLSTGALNPVVILTQHNYLPRRVEEVPKQWNPVVRMPRIQVQEGLVETSTEAVGLSETPIAPIRVRPEVYSTRDVGVRRRHAVVPHTVDYRKAITCSEQDIEEQATRVHYLGTLTYVCQNCNAEYFAEERSNREENKVWCCYRGEIELPTLNPCPKELYELLTQPGKENQEFRDNIRAINSNFAMASFKMTGESNNNLGQGHWCFVLCGDVYHFSNGPASTQELQQPNLNHYYFIDPEEALSHRQSFIGDRVSSETLKKIEIMLRSCNVFVNTYRHMGEIIDELKKSVPSSESRHIVDRVVLAFKDTTNMSSDNRRNFNLPTCNREIGAVFLESELPNEVELKLYPRSRGIPNSIKNLNRLADPLVYPLLFPYGEYGYDMNIKLKNRPTKSVTIRQFYRYRLFTRKNQFSIIHSSGKLFQQYIVDGWIRAENNDLWYLKENQKKFRFVQEAALRRLLRNPVTASNTVEAQQLGKKVVILPASFKGGERNKIRQYLDSMAMVARHGKPDLFITFTCNPNWKEIKENLKYPLRYQDRIDLVCRVFQMKLLQFIKDIVHNQIYGVVKNYLYVIEFQKRGLPHAHIVVTFINEDKLETPEDIDCIISAVIPDANVQPTLYQIVKDHYVHRVCGPENENAPCMRDGRCSKRYPKNFQESTIMNQRGTSDGTNIGQASYRRPNDGRNIQLDGYVVDNRRIVPYNPFAAAKYQSHINFEACGSLASIKYLHKYVQKGSDQATVAFMRDTSDQGRREQMDIEQEHSEHIQEIEVPRMVERDEIQSYIDCRYVTSTEAFWRLFEFRLYDRSHTVVVFPVHTANNRNILIEEAVNEEELSNAINKESKLEAWFKLNQQDFEARQYFYHEIPEYYVWNNKDSIWQQRSKTCKVIGCVASIAPSPENMELFYLRILLHHIKGAQSYNDLKTVNQTLHSTYQSACVALGLLDDAQEYDKCLEQVALNRHPKQLRNLFALLCCTIDANYLQEIPRLWDKYIPHLTEDYTYQGYNQHVAVKKAYKYINEILGRNRQEYSLRFLGVVISDDENSSDESGPVNAEDNVQSSRVYDPSLLNDEQKIIFNEIIDAIRLSEIYNSSRIFFIDGPGGTGKTYLYNTIITYLRNIEKKTAAVAWTGIAATLLRGGKTCHSAFRIPVSLNKDSVAGWPLEHRKSVELQGIKLILWDEAPMTPKDAVHAVDKYLKDLKKSNCYMGGVVTVFGGDFRQTLPVIPHGSRRQIVQSTLKYSSIWQNTRILRLTKNMRASRSRVASDYINGSLFSEFLLKIGEGRIPVLKKTKSTEHAKDDLIEIDRKLIVTTIDDLVEFVYGYSDTGAIDIGKKAILCPTNVTVDNMNRKILDVMLPGESRTYFSTDEFRNDESNELEIPIDVLNSINASSVPPHMLELKIGCIVMLIRNLDIAIGLCNGTRLMITELRDNVVQAMILNGYNSGELHWLPRIAMICSDTGLPKPFTRLQFPIKLAYAMTINKAQGQTFDRVGVYLKTPCFSHGQLYVALSRVRDSNSIRIFIENSSHHGTFKFRNRTFTRNVVYPEILGDVNTATDVALQEIEPETFNEGTLEAFFNVDEELEYIQQAETGIRTPAVGKSPEPPNYTIAERAKRVSDNNRPGTSTLHLTPTQGNNSKFSASSYDSSEED